MRPRRRRGPGRGRGRSGCGCPRVRTRKRRRGAGRRGDQCLRAVAARHADDIGTLGDGLLRQRPQVVPALQDDRRDRAAPRLGLQVELVDLPAAGPPIHDQDTAVGRSNALDFGAPVGQVVSERDLCGCRGDQDEPDQQCEAHRRAEDQQHDEHNQSHDRDSCGDGACCAPVDQRRPSGDHHDEDQEQRPHQAERIVQETGDGECDRQQEGDQRPSRREPALKSRCRTCRARAAPRRAVRHALLRCCHRTTPPRVAEQRRTVDRPC
jgi:hypothetical protein